MNKYYKKNEKKINMNYEKGIYETLIYPGLNKEFLFLYPNTLISIS